jgi:hypothetical protein
MRSRYRSGPNRCRGGVALGDCSEFLLEAIEPRYFVAIDLVELHKIPEVWGHSTIEVFGERSHLDYYRCRFERFGNRVRVEVGSSQDKLAQFPNETFALIYIDPGTTMKTSGATRHWRHTK